MLSIVIPGNSAWCSSRKKISFWLAASFTVTGVTRSPPCFSISAVTSASGTPRIRVSRRSSEYLTYAGEILTAVALVFSTSTRP